MASLWAFSSPPRECDKATHSPRHFSYLLQNSGGRGLHHLFLDRASCFYASVGSRIPYLAFADDTIVFTRCSEGAVIFVRKFSIIYQEMCGQKVNANKSSFICSSRATLEQVSSMSSVLGFKEGLLPLTYLGVPLVRDRLGCIIFDGLLAKLRQ